MGTNVWKGVLALCVVAVTMASCDFVNKMKENATTTPSDTIIGANVGELDGKIDELLELAKAKKETAEFAEIYTYLNYKPGNPSTSVTIQIVTPEDKNKMAEYSWYDNKDVRNKLDKQDMVISDHDDNVIDTYDASRICFSPIMTCPNWWRTCRCSVKRLWRRPDMGKRAMCEATR